MHLLHTTEHLSGDIKAEGHVLVTKDTPRICTVDEEEQNEALPQQSQHLTLQGLHKNWVHGGFYYLFILFILFFLIRIKKALFKVAPRLPNFSPLDFFSWVC